MKNRRWNMVDKWLNRNNYQNDRILAHYILLFMVAVLISGVYLGVIGIIEKVQTEDKRPVILETVNFRTRQVTDRTIIFGKDHGADMSLAPRVRQIVE